MQSSLLLALLTALPATLAQVLSNETVLGVYIFHRHGDRTAKMTPPANLTYLGYQEVFTSGSYYRNRYIAGSAPYQISGISDDIVKQSQIQASAPADTVLQNSAMGFLQGLYPPVGTGLDMETLRNGTTITAPMQGFQLIPVGLVQSGSGSEDSTWLESTTGCAAATVSSNNYFLSPEYTSLLSSTDDFYQSLLPVINGTFNSSTDNFKNAYTIFDLINVAEIHNASINSSELLTSDTLFQLRTLADTHEWNLAYNASERIRAVAGSTLAAEIVQFLNGTINSSGAQKFGVQFGNYATFSSFFGLADLPSVNPDLYGVPDYASAMTFEMFTNSSSGPFTKTDYPSTDDIYVRFLFHNGTTSNSSEPVPYPLFGSGQETLSWDDFVTGMGEFSIGNTEQWCTACGNFTGTCTAYAPNGSGPSLPPSMGHQENGLSAAVNGVIGAMVTLAVVLGLEALVMVLGGLRLVSKKRLARGSGAGALNVGSEMTKA